jgi:hypothetical protein
MTLPKAEHDAPEWQAAIRALMLVVEHDGQTLLARIGMMRALYPLGAPTLTPRKKRRGNTESSDDLLLLELQTVGADADTPCRASTLQGLRIIERPGTSAGRQMSRHRAAMRVLHDLARDV